MSEPGLGSDVAAIKSKAVRQGDTDDWVIDGQKMWLTNGGSSNLVAVLVRTDLGESSSPYKNMTTFLIDKTAGFGETAQGVTVPGKIDKMGYKGSTPPNSSSPATAPPRPRSSAASRAGLLPDDGRRRGRPCQRRRPGVRVSMRAFELGIAYSQQRRDLRQEDRRTPGHPLPARRHGDQGRSQPPDDGQGRAPEGLQRPQRPRAGMAKYLAAENCADVVEQSLPASTAATATPRV